MPIPIPVTETIIDTPQWGIPITNKVNELDLRQFPKRYTRANRPTSGNVDGDMIYETDTHMLFVWNASVSKWRGVRTWQILWNGGGGTTPNANDSPVVINSVNVPDQGCDGRLQINAHAYYATSVPTDAFWLHMKAGASEIAQWRSNSGISQGSAMASMVGSIAQLAGTSTTIQITLERKSGSGTGTAYGDGTLNSLHVVFIPDA